MNKKCKRTLAIKVSQSEIWIMVHVLSRNIEIEDLDLIFAVKGKLQAGNFENVGDLVTA